MVKTRSHDGDSKGKELDVEDPMGSRLSRLEDMFAERNKMMKQFADMVKALAGKIEFGDPPNGEFGESVEHRMVNLVPKAQEENPKLEKHEGWEQMVILEVEGDAEKGQEVQSMEKICSAHQVFDKMSLGVQSKRRQIKCHKSWRFKFKQRKRQRGKPRTAHKLIYKGILLIDSEDHLSSSMVKEIGIEISSDRWLSNSIGCELETGETVNDEYRVPSDSDLIMNDTEKDKERLKWKKRRKSLKSWRFKFKSQDLRGHNLSRVTLQLKNSLVITGSWRRFMMVKGYEQCHMLEHANIEAESFPILNFAEEQPILWVHNSSEKILIVLELESGQRLMRLLFYLGFHNRSLKIAYSSWEVRCCERKSRKKCHSYVGVSELLKSHGAGIVESLTLSLLINVAYEKKYVSNNDVRSDFLNSLSDALIEAKFVKTMEEYSKNHLVSTLAYDLFHSPRPPELFVAERMIVTKVEMEEDMKVNDQKQQGDCGHYSLLVAAANWSSQMHLWSASYQVWHRWKARWFFVGMISSLNHVGMVVWRGRI